VLAWESNSIFPWWTLCWSSRDVGQSLQSVVTKSQMRRSCSPSLLKLISICPDTSPFLELSNQPERSLFIIQWYQECPSLVPCGPKVGRR
jgi:hypothetical protein